MALLAVQEEQEAQAARPMELGLQVGVPTFRLEVLLKWVSIVECVLESARPSEVVVVTIPVLAERSDLEWGFPSGCRQVP